VKLFSKFSNLGEKHTWTSQTDGHTDDLLWHNRGKKPRRKAIHARYFSITADKISEKQ